MKYIIFTTLTALVISCGTKTNNEVKNDNPEDTVKNETEEPVDNTCSINENEFGGVEIGMSMEKAFSTNDDLESELTIEETGEGDMEFYAMTNENGDQIARVFEMKGSVFGIDVLSEDCSLENGIHVGSTLGELKEAYPNYEIHGSEIEGRTSLTVEGMKIAFYIEVGIWNYDLTEEDEKLLADDVKVYQISLW